EAASCAAAFGTEARVVEKHGTRAWTIAFRLAHQRVTREHIATLVGVSATTVSKALNGPQRDTPLHRRIRSTAEELGYTASSPRNYLQERIVELGLDGTGSHDKFVPDVVFTLPREQVAMFLSRLFATDGSAWVAEGHSYFGISYCSVSERLIHDV
ncbi:MAG: LacI family DNA-binding transcriptional regulator, partial [Nitriliruptor sp.]